MKDNLIQLNSKLYSHKKNHVLVPLITIALIMIFYFFQSPATVQMLDTGELVTNSFLLRLIHPPGYPLFTWTYYLVTHFPFFDNPFLLASIFTSLLGGLCLLLIGRTFRAKLPTAFISVALVIVATAPVFWRYALLPDVFMMHILFMCFLCYLHITSGIMWGIKKENLFYLFWMVSMAHHHTTFFMFPLFIQSFISFHNRKNICFILAGALATVGLYASLILLDSSSMTAWAKIETWQDIINHFLRTDYGTLSLSATGLQTSLLQTLLKNLEFYFSGSINSYLAFYCFLFIGLVMEFKRFIKDKIILSLGLSYFSYIIVFFALANISPSGQGAEVLSRFTLMPDIVLIFLCLYMTATSSLLKQNKFLIIFYILAGLSVTKNIVENRSENNFKANTVMSDWAHNKLDAAQSSKSEVLVLVTEDSKLFSLYYVQNILGYQSQIKVFSPRLLFYEWYFDKVLANIGNLNLDKKGVTVLKKYDLHADLILQNLGRYSFFVKKSGFVLRDATSSFTPIGTIVYRGAGPNSFDESILRRTQRSIISSYRNSLFENEKRILGEACEFYYRFGKYTSSKSGLQAGMDVYKRGLEIVPFCTAVAFELCQSEPTHIDYCLRAQGR